MEENAKTAENAAPEDDAGHKPRVPRKKTRGGAHRLFVVVLCLILAVVVWRVFLRGDTATKSGPPQVVLVPVRAKEAVRGDFKQYFTSLGTVTAANTVVVRTRVDGQLMRLNFSEGQTVKAGDILAEIDPRPYEAQLAQAQGQLMRDEALLKNARQNLARSEVLIKQNSTTPQDVDSNRALVLQYEGIVKADHGQIDSVKLQLEYCRVSAPVGGKLGLRTVDAGNIVNASDTSGLVTITQVEPVNVLFTVTDAQLAEVLTEMRAGNTLETEAWDRTGKTLLATGKVVSLDNQIDAATGTVKVKAEFPNTDGALFPNQFINARLLVATRKDVVIVPSTAVQAGRGGKYVYVAVPDADAQAPGQAPGQTPDQASGQTPAKPEGKGAPAAAPAPQIKGRTSLRLVKLGPADDTWSVITEGVNPGDLVVTEGVDLLGDKTPVNIIKAEK